MKPNPMSVVAGFLSEKDSDAAGKPIKDLIRDLINLLKPGLAIPKAAGQVEALRINIPEIKKVLKFITDRVLGLDPKAQIEFKRQAPEELTMGWNPLSKEPIDMKKLEAYAETLAQDPEALKEAIKTLTRLQTTLARYED